MDDVTLGKLLTEAHRGQVDYCEPEGVSVSQSSSSVVFDGSGKPDGERNVDQSVGFGVTRNTYSAHSKFPENTQAEKMVDGSGKPDERNSSNAQIRILIEEQRQMIIAEYREKIGHHELQAAHAEEERRLLREELWRQKLEFREVHQQSLTEMEELRKFQRELSGSVQELQNEVNCMNDSKDFQDAESVRRDVEAFFRIAAPQRRCEGEVIVQGDEGPVGGVAQVVDCHGVTVGHEEREEKEVEQEVESDGEKTLKERCACPWMG